MIDHKIALEEVIVFREDQISYMTAIYIIVTYFESNMKTRSISWPNDYDEICICCFSATL